MSEYTLTVGLEIHAELNTQTKMFCNSKNDPEEKRPNVNTCPVCLGYPGTLPVINMEAVRSVLRLGVALGGELADYTEFDRKNYFYPDIPKGYQISQYKHPLVQGGKLLGVPITRVHLEEDTARSIHPEGKQASNGTSEKGYSLLDFNRAGVPLMELVTEPAIHDALTASKFAKELQLTLLYLGVSHANMEKGEMRVEANISVGKNGEMGTKVEVKNLNSFKAVEKAIRYEMNRHIELLDRGERIVQETRGWDENKEETFPQRAKEESHDYRYFPDPDLPKLFISEIPEFSRESLKGSLPVLPEEKRGKLQELGIAQELIEGYITNLELGRYMDGIIESADKTLVKVSSNFLSTDPSLINVSEENFIKTMQLVVDNVVSSTSAKIILKELKENNIDPMKIAEEKDLVQISDENILRAFVEEAIKENAGAPAPYIVGQAIKKSKGKGNPSVINKLVVEMLDH